MNIFHVGMAHWRYVHTAHTGYNDSNAPKNYDWLSKSKFILNKWMYSPGTCMCVDYSRCHLEQWTHHSNAIKYIHLAVYLFYLKNNIHKILFYVQWVCVCECRTWNAPRFRNREWKMKMNDWKLDMKMSEGGLINFYISSNNCSLHACWMCRCNCKNGRQLMLDVLWILQWIDNSSHTCRGTWKGKSLW